MKMGRLGVWAQVDCMTASAEAEFARDVEQWGYSALWTPEAKGRDVLVNSSESAGIFLKRVTQTLAGKITPKY